MSSFRDFMEKVAQAGAVVEARRTKHAGRVAEGSVVVEDLGAAADRTVEAAAVQASVPVAA